MASRTAVIESLAALATNFAGDVTAEKIGTWQAALTDIPDEAVKAATVKVLRSHTGAFLPPVAVIREAALPELPVDVSSLLTAIDKAGEYNPQAGWVRPRVERVRALFGDALANAYGAAGGASRLFSTNDTTREIAERDFAKALEEERGQMIRLPVGMEPKALLR